MLGNRLDLRHNVIDSIPIAQVSGSLIRNNEYAYKERLDTGVEEGITDIRYMGVGNVELTV